MFLSEGQRSLGMPDTSVIFLTGVCGNVWMIVEEERMSWNHRQTDRQEVSQWVQQFSVSSVRVFKQEVLCRETGSTLKACGCCESISNMWSDLMNLCVYCLCIVECWCCVVVNTWETVCVSVWVCEWVCVSVCVCERERERESVCVCVRERERESVWVWVCVCVRECVCVCVCMCVRERESVWVCVC